MQNAARSASWFAANVGRRYVVVSCFTTGRKAPPVGKPTGQASPRASQNTGSTSEFTLPLLKHRRRPHPFGRRGMTLMVKCCVSTSRDLKATRCEARSGMHPGRLLSAFSISWTHRQEVGPFKPGTCQCPALGTLVCVQTPP